MRVAKIAVVAVKVPKIARLETARGRNFSSCDESNIVGRDSHRL